jgi:S1-C subfamily serine protease
MLYAIHCMASVRALAWRAVAAAGAAATAAGLGACSAARPPEPVAVAAPPAPPSREAVREAVLQRILPSSVQIVVEHAEGQRLRTGSGVAIGVANPGAKGCFVLTAGHTVSGPVDHRQVFVIFGRDRGKYEKARAAVVAHRDSPDLDLAVLQAESPQCEPAAAGSPPSLGTPVWVVGFPWGKSMTLASGVVSQVDSAQPRDEEEGARLMVDASVSYGISGGPVFDARSGRLIGIVEGYNTARVTPHGAAGNWYIDVPVPGQTVVTPLGDIRRFLTDAGLGTLADQVNGHAQGDPPPAPPYP